MLFLPYELEYMLRSLESVEDVPGDIAEVGVFEGYSASQIAQHTDKPIHLFDTFEGLPEPNMYDSGFMAGQYKSSMERAVKALEGLGDITIYKGLFPDTAGPIQDKRFSFVHFDGDIYQSAKDTIGFFYPRLNEGGLILLHDMRDGVMLAVQNSGHCYMAEEGYGVIRKKQQ